MPGFNKTSISKGTLQHGAFSAEFDRLGLLYPYDMETRDHTLGNHWNKRE